MTASTPPSVTGSCGNTKFFNLFNHASFGPPGRSLATPATLGLITTQTTPARNIQFALKLYF